MTETPRISVVIPMRNEETRIKRCLESVLANGYPQDRLEIIIVDGASEDRSRNVVQALMTRHPGIRILQNPQRITPVGMNIGIEDSTGDLVIVLNAHATLAPTFLAENVRAMKEHPECDAVGGLLRSVGEGAWGRAVSAVLNSPLGAGGRRYRTRREPGYIRDTVPYAAYPRETFQKFGLVDEDLVRTQDAEFNYRLLQQGGKIYFDPRILAELTVRGSPLTLAFQQLRTGYWKVLLFKKGFLPTHVRYLVPALFVLTLGTAGLAATFSSWGQWLLFSLFAIYGTIVLAASAGLAARMGQGYALLLPWVFLLVHFSYGTGTLAGFWAFGIHRRKNRGGEPPACDVPAQP